MKSSRKQTASVATGSVAPISFNSNIEFRRPFTVGLKLQNLLRDPLVGKYVIEITSDGYSTTFIGKDGITKISADFLEESRKKRAQTNNLKTSMMAFRKRIRTRKELAGYSFPENDEKALLFVEEEKKTKPKSVLFMKESAYKLFLASVKKTEEARKIISEQDKAAATNAAAAQTPGKTPATAATTVTASSAR